MGYKAYPWMELTNNVYVNTSGTLKRINQGYSSGLLLDDSGNITFQVAGTGNADTTVSFANAVTVANSGNVGMGRRIRGKHWML